MKTEPVISFVNVSKAFRGLGTVLEDITFSVKAGEVLGLIGPNGCGKTTVMRIAAGLARQTSGEVRVNGLDMSQERWAFPPSIGILLDPPGLLPHLSGRQNLHLLASLRSRLDAAQVDEAMRRVGLNPARPQPVRTYSLGMRQRLGIAQAVMDQPDVLLLDEPTNALDVDSVEVVSTIIRQERERGAAILIVSHNMEEIASLSDRILRLENGRLREVERDSLRPLPKRS